MLVMINDIYHVKYSVRKSLDKFERFQSYQKSQFVSFEYWRRYITWEKTNPIKTEDTSLFIRRG